MRLVVTDVDKLNDVSSGPTAERSHVTQLLSCFLARPKDSGVSWSVRSKTTSSTSDPIVRECISAPQMMIPSILCDSLLLC